MSKTKNRQKGAAFELKCKKYLEEIGWIIDKARPTIKWIGPGRCISGPNDFFGVADLIGVHPDKDHVLFVQCTTNKGNISSKCKKMAGFPWNLKCNLVLVWSKDDRVRNMNCVYRLYRNEERKLYWSEFYFNPRKRLPEELFN